MGDPESVDTALRAANLALSGRRQNEASRFASIELRAKDPQNRGWATLAIVSVGACALLIVIGAWFL